MRKAFAMVMVVALGVALLGAAAYLTLYHGTEPGQPAVPGDADYSVSGNVVLAANGSEVFTGSDFTEALGWAVSQEGRSAYVPRGNYTLTGSLSVASNVTLSGEGDDASGTVFNFTSQDRKQARIELLNVNDVALKSFRVVGNGNIHMWSEGSVHGRFLVENVTIYGTSSLQPGAFMTWTSGHGSIENVSFVRCKAIGTASIGFNLQGDGGPEMVRSSGGWVRNASFYDCIASHCGYDQRFNDWVCGFDLAEGTNVENLYLSGCVATDNWVDGFHLEARPYAVNCVLENCTARNNSVREPNLGSDFAWNSQTQDVRLINSS